MNLVRINRGLTVFFTVMAMILVSGCFEKDSKESNAKLKSISISANGKSIGITPIFSGDKTEYSTVVENNISEVVVGAEAESGKAAVSGTGKMAIVEGENKLVITVKAEDSSVKKDYTIKVTRKLDQNVNLKNISLATAGAEIAFTPIFSAGTLTYSAIVENEVTEIIVNAEAESIKGSMSGLGKVTLSEGENKIVISVKSQDNTVTKNYQIIVIRKAKVVVLDKNANLKSLDILSTKGTLPITPAFGGETTSYSATVENEVTEVTVSASAVGIKSVVSGTGKAVLAEGENKIVVTVKAEDTTVKKDYTIRVTRKAKSTEFDPTKDLKINVQKKSDWTQAIIWYDQNKDGSWETTTIGDPNTLTTEYKAGWNTRIFKNTSKIEFLFNKGDWSDKIAPTDGNFVYENGPGEIWITNEGKLTTYDPTAITIYMEKPDSWEQPWMWFDQNKDGSWETMTVKQPPGDMQPLTGRAGWYTKTFENTTKIEFLFNKGDWTEKVEDSGGNFVILNAGKYWVTKTGKLLNRDPVGTIIMNFEKPDNWSEVYLNYDQGKTGTWAKAKLNTFRPNWFNREAFTNTMKIEFYLDDGKGNTLKNAGQNFLIDVAGEYWISKAGEVKTKDFYVEPTDGIVYNSRDVFYKSPYGAVPERTEVTYKFESDLNSLTSANLIIERQDIVGDRNISYTKIDTVAMTKESKNGKDYWIAKYKFNEKHVYGYYFEVFKDNYKRIVSGAGDKIAVAHYKLPKTGGMAVLKQTLPVEGEFIQTVYDSNFKTPDWAKDIVFYYIFPERFRNGNKANDRKVGIDKFYGNKDVEVHTNWLDAKPWVPGDGKSDKEYCNDFYGGDLAGITEKLDYLKDLGINTIYTNPIFEAPSNHKYDTTDFKSIDHSFGTLEDFKTLTAEAKKRGIRIILDTSLNHSGSDSVYMDRYGKYDDRHPGVKGAFQNEVIHTDSPYYDWYLWNPGASTADGKYNQWANPTLATLNPDSVSYRQFALSGEDSVTKYWLKQGSSGWRMDVAPWKPDAFWREFRTAVKSTDSDAFTVAETWWDSSKYFVGDMFDSTMNYIFRQAMFNFAGGTMTAKETNDMLEMMRENYPSEAFYSLMNLLSTHDAKRALYTFGYTEQGGAGYSDAVKKLKLCVLFQMIYPGAPTVYYGDEIGMTGGDDPNNRGPYPWKDLGGNPDENLLGDFKQLIKMRNDNPILRRGSLIPIYSDDNVIAFVREYEGKKALIVVNNSNSDKQVEIPVNISGKLNDVLNSGTYTVNNGKITITAKGYWGAVLIGI